MIYLDYNATTPVADRVLEAMRPWFSSRFGNPSSVHALGRVARAAVEKARQQVAALIGAAPEEIVFTSGGTESNNIAVLGPALPRGGGHVVISAVEHPAVREPARHLESLGFAVSVVGVDGQKSMVLRDTASLNSVKTAIQTFYAERGKYPYDLSEIKDLLGAGYDLSVYSYDPAYGCFPEIETRKP